MKSKLSVRIKNAWRVLTGERVLFSSFERRVQITAARVNEKYYSVYYEKHFANDYKPKYKVYFSKLKEFIEAETEDECIHKLKVALGAPEVQPAQLH